jgi:hypothetical protein
MAKKIAIAVTMTILPFGNGRYKSVAFIQVQVGPLGCFAHVSITTPIASALKTNMYIAF